MKLQTSMSAQPGLYLTKLQVKKAGFFSIGSYNFRRTDVCFCDKVFEVSFYAPNFEKVGSILLSACPFVRLSVRPSVRSKQNSS